MRVAADDELERQVATIVASVATIRRGVLRACLATTKCTDLSGRRYSMAVLRQAAKRIGDGAELDEMAGALWMRVSGSRRRELRAGG